MAHYSLSVWHLFCSRDRAKQPFLKEGAMENGFFEFGLFALVAFAFVNLIWGATLDAPPVRRRTLNLKELEAGVSFEGAELVTPTLKEKIHVG
jgi:hypothetical protein